MLVGSPFKVVLDKDNHNNINCKSSLSSKDKGSDKSLSDLGVLGKFDDVGMDSLQSPFKDLQANFDNEIRRQSTDESTKDKPDLQSAFKRKNSSDSPSIVYALEKPDVSGLRKLINDKNICNAQNKIIGKTNLNCGSMSKEGCYEELAVESINEEWKLFDLNNSNDNAEHFSRAGGQQVPVRFNTRYSMQAGSDQGTLSQI